MKSSRPATTDIPLHTTMGGGGILSDVTRERDMSSNKFTTRSGSLARNTNNAAAAAGTACASPALSTSQAGLGFSGLGSFSLSQYRHDSLDVKAEVDRMYNNILRTLEASAAEPFSSASVVRTETHSLIAARQQHSSLDVNYAIVGDGTPSNQHTAATTTTTTGGGVFSTNTRLISNTSRDSGSPHPAHSYVNAMTDSRVAAMQALLRHHKPFGSASTSGLYRSNTFGSGRKGMSDAVTKMDTPGPGSYHSEDGSRCGSSRRRAGSTNERCASAPRARSAERGVSFGKSARPPLVLSDREIYQTKREPAMRPPGPGDYVAPSTFEAKKPSSTKGSFGTADRDAGKSKSIAPGPGSYAISDNKELDSNKLSNKSPAFASNTPRLPSVKTDAPGPGAYIVDSAPKPAQLGYSFGKAPLPTLAGPSEVTPGPSDYHVELDDPHKHMRGVIPTAGRDDSAWGGKKLSEDTPGPGAYTIRLEERDGVSMKFRYKEKIDSIPGPGYYTPDEVQKQSGPAWSMVGKIAEKIPEITPGPGQYNDVAGDQSKGITFGGAKRETPADLASKDDMPGPGYYETTTSLREVGAASFGNAKRENEFEARAKRKAEEPGPGAYDPDVAECLTEKRAPVTSLTSNSDRFSLSNNDAPGPGHYLITYDPQTVIGGVIEHAPRKTESWSTHENGAGNLGPGAYDAAATFNSGKAFSIGLPIKQQETRSSTGPMVGPGAYDTLNAGKAVLPSSPNITLGKENRFGVSPKDPEVPGPGAYDVVDPDTWLFEKAPMAVFGNAPRLSPDPALTLGPGAYMYEHPLSLGAAPVGGAIGNAARFPNDIAERERLGSVPGPGAYDVPSVAFDPRKAITIGGTSHSTIANNTDTPGPGAYHTNVTTFVEQGITIGQAPQRPEIKPNEGPGPGSYDTRHTAIDPHISAPTITGRQDEKVSSEGAGPGAYDPTYSHLPSAPSFSLDLSPRNFDIVRGKDVPGPGYYNPHETDEESGRERNSVGLLASGAPRFADPNPSLTPGPGAYNPSDYHEVMEAKPGVTIGGTGHENHRTFVDVPGPGTYDPRLPQRGGFTIHAYEKSKDPRSSGGEDVPGPGAYEVPSALSNQAPSFGVGPRPPLYHPDTDIPGPGRYDPHSAMKMLHQSSPAYSFSSAAKYGIPDSRALFPGPGAYAPVFDVKEPQGPAYSFGRGERPELHPATTNVPGPGVYEIASPSQAPAFSFPTAPRSTQPPASNVPGPGAYDAIISSNGPFYSIGGYGSRSEPDKTDEVPGPGSYNIGRSGVLAGDDCAPAYSFGSAPKHLEAASFDHPGPGHYNPQLYAEGPFYSIAGKYSVPSEPRQDVPGPGAYELGTTLDTHGGASLPQAPRFPPAPSEDVPGPGTYLSIDRRKEGPEITFPTAPRNATEPQSIAPGPGAYDQTLSPQGPWYSIAGKRKQEQENDAPGPGAYDGALPSDNRGAVMLGAPRFEREPGEDIPGPGMYSLAPQWNEGRAALFPTAERPSDRELRQAAAVPGPGQYSVEMPRQGPFYSIQGKQREEMNAAEHVPGPGAYELAPLEKGPSALFGNTARTESDPRQAFPGPGAYSLPNALSPLGVTFGVAPRTQIENNNEVPGPGFYDARGPGMFDGPKYSFPLAANRLREANDVPGPGMYEAGSGKDLTMPQEAVFTFARANRAPYSNAESGNSVGPGAYNLGEAPHAGPSYSIAQAAPFGRPTAAADTPGPGSYAPANLWNRGEGPTIQGKWRDGSASAVPGPGAYRTHDFDPYARDTATVIDFSKGGERIVNAPIKTVTSVGPGEYYKQHNYMGTKQFRFLERYPEPYIEVTPGPPDYHRPNVENPFYDPLAR